MPLSVCAAGHQVQKVVPLEQEPASVTLLVPLLAVYLPWRILAEF